MNSITWLDLYNFLYQQANDIKNIGKFQWDKPVIIHDADTGDEMLCDTYFISDYRGGDRLVLVTNIHKIFTENKNGS